MKLCECGCGRPAPIAKMTNARMGHVRGLPTRFILGHAMRGKRSGNWQGGRLESKGRILLYVTANHPMATSTGYVFEHRLVMAEKLGRLLTSDEHVHHIDLDPSNNKLGNLALVTRAQHSHVHHLIERHGVGPREAIKQVLGGTG